jgi:L-2-hydroxyglutarate oxidase LhgO
MSIRCFLPDLRHEDIVADTVGIQAKLQAPGESFRDFIIKEESGAGLPGFINCIGIESPGLTACLSIARKVPGVMKIVDK